GSGVLPVDRRPSHLAGLLHRPGGGPARERSELRELLRERGAEGCAAGLDSAAGAGRSPGPFGLALPPRRRRRAARPLPVQPQGETARPGGSRAGAALPGRPQGPARLWRLPPLLAADRWEAKA